MIITKIGGVKMYTCKKCGKKNCKDELCYQCKLASKLITVQPCAICGKPVKGTICKECRQRTAIKNNQQYCIVCGKPLSTSYNPKRLRCRACAAKDTGARIKKETHVGVKLNCEFCGAYIPQNETLPPCEARRFCSLQCASRYGHSIRNHTKEHTIDKIKSYIKDKGEYVSKTAIKKSLKLNDKQLRTYNINVDDINKELGYAKPVIVSRGRKKGKTYGKQDPNSEKAKELEAAIVSWIKEQGHCVPIREILKHFHISYDGAWHKYAFDNVELHYKAGVPYSRNSSWFEIEAAKVFKEYFGDDKVVSQKRYPDLVGPKGWALRFDVYLVDLNTLVEIDGEQHYTDHIYKKDNNYDRIKEQYARDHGIPLHRIRIAPSSSFIQRVRDFCETQLEVIKES